MKFGYIRIAAGLPGRQEQEDALRAAGIEDFTDGGPVWFDRGRATLTAGALDRMHAGDELVVANHAILGETRDRVLKVLQAIGQRQGVLFDARTGKSISLSPEVLAMMESLNQAETMRRSFALTKARVRRAELGRKGGTPTKLTGEAKEAALAIWLDPALTGKQAAAKIGISKSTAYRQLGSRDEQLTARDEAEK